MSAYNSRPAKKRNHRNALSNTDHKIRVFGYCRVSTDMQAQHGLSLEAQLEEIKRCAAETTPAMTNARPTNWPTRYARTEKRLLRLPKV